MKCQSKLVAVLCVFMVSGVVRSQTMDLYEVYLQALEYDPQIRIAQHQLGLVTAEHGQARGRLLPQINASMSLTENDLSSPEDPTTPREDYSGERMSLSLRQTLFNWQLLARKAAAKELIAQREEDLVEAMGTLLMTVLKRYLEVLIAQENLALLDAEVNLAERQRAAVEKRHQRSLASVTELYETRSRADLMRIDRIDAANTLEMAKASLRELTGQPVKKLVSAMNLNLLPEISGDADAFVRSALRKNPEVRSKVKAVRAARKMVDASVGEYLPKVEFVFNHQDSDVGFDNRLTPRRKTEYTGIEVSVPLFSGGVARSGVRAAQYRRDIAQEEAELARRTVEKATREAYLSATSGFERIVAANSALGSTESSYKAMLKGFELGTVTSIDVLEALRLKTRAQRDFQKARYTYVYHYMNLKKLTGVIEPDDLHRLNGLFVVDESYNQPQPVDDEQHVEQEQAPAAEPATVESAATPSIPELIALPAPTAKPSTRADNAWPLAQAEVADLLQPAKQESPAQ